MDVVEFEKELDPEQLISEHLQNLVELDMYSGDTEVCGLISSVRDVRECGYASWIRGFEIHTKTGAVFMISVDRKA